MTINFTNPGPLNAPSPKAIRRRDFLRLCAVGTMPGLLAACQNGSVAPVHPMATRHPPLQPSPTRRPTLSETDWAELARSLHGSLIRPGSSRYSTARQLFNTRFDSVHPAAIAYCASPEDVQTCLAFVRRFGLPLTPRAGGHSYAGYSTTSGLIIDVTPMNTVHVDEASGTVTVGAGARLIDIYAALAPYGLVLPAGTCATVGIAGLALGGGISVLSRKFGLTCDNLLSARVVVADGRVLTCDAAHEADLFWALRGGGGGNFGVVTSFTFHVYPVAALSLFNLRWPWSSAGAVLDAWQNWAPHAPDELWSSCKFQATRDKSANPIVQVDGAYIGDIASLDTLLEQLTGQLNTVPLSRSVWEADLLEAMLDEANCGGLSVSQCHLPSQNPDGLLGRSTFQTKSDFFTHALPTPGIDTLVKAITNCQASPVLGEGGLGIDAFGGAVNRVAEDATAFVHRNALFSIQYTATWDAGDSLAVATANQRWLAEMWQTMRPYASGFAYQNYIDPNLINWQQAYYGANLLRLQRIKVAYDPANVFHFAQSIPPED